MRVRIEPSVASGTVIAPASKSLTHRALICGALTEGSIIRNVTYSEDVMATLRCLRAMGANVTCDGDCVHVGGLNPWSMPENAVLDCGESGSTLRFLLPLCLVSPTKTIFTGSKRLFQRPLDVYEQLCCEHGLTFIRTETGIAVGGGLLPGTFQVRGDISSQFISGLLLALPMLNGDSVVRVMTPLESAPYVQMTQAVQSRFGVDIQADACDFFVKGKQNYHAYAYTVDGDCSNVAYLEAYNLVGGHVKALGLSHEIPQSDGVYEALFEQMQAGGQRFDLTHCPDLGPILFALAAVIGEVTFTGIRRLRLKESDRIASMVCALAKFGVSATLADDTVTIHGGHINPPMEILGGYKDHRVVMALSLLCSRVGGVIDGAQAVAKSYPDYFDAIRSLGIRVSQE